VPVAQAQWREVLAVQEERTVAADNTVAWKRLRLQSGPRPLRKAKARVHEYPDGDLAIFHGPCCLVPGGQTTVRNQINHSRPAVPLAAPLDAEAKLIHSFYYGKRINQAVNLCA